MADKKFWIALVIITIVLAILAYFSINLRNYVTGKAMINPPFSINAWDIKTSELVLQIENNEQEDYQIREINIEGCGSYATPTSFPSGSSLTVIIPCIPELSGSSFESDITVVYKQSETEFTSSGTLSGKVRK